MLHEPVKALKPLPMLELPKIPGKGREQTLQEWHAAGGSVPVQYKSRPHVWHAKVKQYADGGSVGGEAYGNAPDSSDSGVVQDAQHFADGGVIHMAGGGRLGSAPSGRGPMTAGQPKRREASITEAVTQGLLPMLYGAAKGSASHVGGVAGDLESLAREGLNFSFGPGGVNLSEETFLPTSEDVRGYLPSLKRFGPTVAGVEDIGADLGQNLVGMMFDPAAFRAATKGAKAVGRGALDLAKSDAAHRVVQKALSSPLMAPSHQMSVVKQPGGNWLTGKVEHDVKHLKTPHGTDYLEADLRDLRSRFGDLPAYETADKEIQASKAADKWVDSNLTKYIKNEMGSPKDPVRQLFDQKALDIEAKYAKDIERADRVAQRAADEPDPQRKANLERESRRLSSKALADAELAEQHITHQKGIEEDQDYFSSSLQDRRLREGFPPSGLATSRSGQAWEQVSDQGIEASRAGNIQKAVQDEDTVKRVTRAWLAKRDALNNNFDEFLRARPNLNESDIYSLNRRTTLDDKARMTGDTEYQKSASEYYDAQHGWSSDDARLGKENPWISKVDPDSSVYSSFTNHLGFHHIVDVLKADMAAGRIRPEQLNKMSMEQAVRRTAEYDLDAAKAAAAARAKSLENMPVLKEYPEGYKWVQLTEPGQFAQESNVMGHSVRGYEPPRGHPEHIPESGTEGSDYYGHGGWDAIKSGKAKIYSLRDPEGMSHATVETSNKPDYDKAARIMGIDDPTQADIASLIAEGKLPNSERITQIKGKRNEKPNEQYQPYVSDFVKSNNWADVGDLENTNLAKLGKNYVTLDELNEAKKPAQKFLAEHPGFEKFRNAHEKLFTEGYGSPEYQANEKIRGQPVHKDIPYTYSDLKAVLENPEDWADKTVGAGEILSKHLELIDKVRRLYGDLPAEKVSGMKAGGEVHMADGGAAFGKYPAMKASTSKGKKEAQYRLPLDVARGAVAGVLGMPGDLETLGRLGLNFAFGPGGVDVSNKSFLPTSEDIEKRIPFRGEEPVNKLGAGFGSLIGGLSPAPANAAIKGAKAVGQGAAKAAKSETVRNLVEKALESPMLAPARPMYAAPKAPKGVEPIVVRTPEERAVIDKFGQKQEQEAARKKKVEKAALSEPDESSAPPKSKGKRTADSADVYRRMAETEGDEAVLKAAKAGEHLKPTASGYVGAPRTVTSPQGLGAMRKAMDKDFVDSVEAVRLADADRLGTWYDRAKQGIAESTEPYQLPRTLEQHGVYSAGVSPESELTFALKHLNSRVAGEPGMAYRGAGMRNLDEAVAENRPANMGFKIGEYANKNDPRLPNTGLFGVNDFRRAQGMGYTDPQGMPWKAGVSATMHPFMDAETALQVNRANTARTGGRTDWAGPHIQEVPWVYGKAQDLHSRGVKGRYKGDELEGIKGALQDANNTARDYFYKQTGSATHEAIPGANTGHVPQMIDAPYAEKVAYGNTGRWDVPAPEYAMSDMGTVGAGNRDAIYSALGYRQLPTIEASGAYFPEGSKIAEHQPVKIARPLLDFPTGGEGLIADPTRQTLEFGERFRALNDAQEAFGFNLPNTMNAVKGKNSLVLDTRRSNPKNLDEPHTGVMPSDQQMGALTQALGDVGYGVAPTSRGATVFPFDSKATAKDARKLMKKKGAELQKIYPSEMEPSLNSSGYGPGVGMYTPEGFRGTEPFSGQATMGLLKEASYLPPEVALNLGESESVRNAIRGKRTRDAGLPGARADIQETRRFFSEADWPKAVALIRQGFTPAAALAALGYSASSMAKDR